MKEITDLIRWCSISLPHRLIVRPHPSENPKNWEQISEGKISVVSNSAPIPWIQHAELVIHANSTTGLEAAILRKPCINIVPAAFEGWAAQFLMSKANVTVSNASAAADKIRAHSSNLQDLGPRSLPKFPPNAARKTARIIAAQLRHMPSHFPFDWRPSHERHDGTRNKFSASIMDFAPAMIPGSTIHQLDESLAVLRAPSQ